MLYQVLTYSLLFASSLASSSVLKITCPHQFLMLLVHFLNERTYDDDGDDDKKSMEAGTDVQIWVPSS